MRGTKPCLLSPALAECSSPVHPLRLVPQTRSRCCPCMPLLGWCLILLCSLDRECLLPPFPPVVLQHGLPFATHALGQGSGSQCVHQMTSGTSQDVDSPLNYAHQADLLGRESAAASHFSPHSSFPPGKGHTGDRHCTQQGEGFTNAVGTCTFSCNSSFSSPERQLSLFPVAT